MTPRDLIAKFKERWTALNRNQRIISVIVAAGVVVCLFYLGQLALRPAYAPLLTGLEPKDAGIIAEKLKSMKIPYKLADQGKTIKVPEQQVYEARIQLASSGALGGGLGFELFDQSKFGQTDFEQQVGYQRALQEELRRTLIQIEGVEQARVHLVIPKKSVFVSDQGTPTVSVALKLKPSVSLKPEQVQGVCDLLQGSVEGLEPDNVYIIDTEGNVLSDSLKTIDPNVAMTRATLEQHYARREYEKELEKRVQQMLTKILGQNKAVVMVTADLDFSQQQSTSTISTNPENVRISEHVISETGAGTDFAGPPGTDSNITTYPFTQGAGESSFTREESTINYQISTIQETTVNAPGSVRRLSASVVVSESDLPVDIQKVTGAVAAAIGYNENRNDQINVSSMAFDDSLKKAEEEKERAELDARQKARVFVYALAGGVALLILLGMLVFFIKKRRSAERVMDDMEEVGEEIVPVSAEELEQAREVAAREDKQKQIKDLAAKNPKDVADVLKVWLNE